MSAARLAQHAGQESAQGLVAATSPITMISRRTLPALSDADVNSLGLFRTSGMSLEQAQEAKNGTRGKLDLQPGLRVLDIGCGWGGLALTLARDMASTSPASPCRPNS